MTPRPTVTSTADSLQITVSREGQQPPIQDHLLLRLPAADSRLVQVVGATAIESTVHGAWREISVVFLSELNPARSSF